MRNLAGRRLGPYELHDVVGRGGMATVYKAYQPSLDRIVAVKVMADKGDAGFAKRFAREAWLIAKLEHRNIVPVYDYGEQHGMVYLVLQYVPGGRTLARLTGSAMAPERAVALLTGLLAALEYAHDRGLIHRDVKPSNVLLREPEWPLLADFGIARLLAPGAATLTRDGTVIGTAAYMAPEQALGEGVDARTDLYATAVVAYELLTGQVPFSADMPALLLAQVVSRAVPPARSVNPAVPPTLDLVLSRALAKDPAERYQRASELAAAFQESLEPHRASSTTTTATYRRPATRTSAEAPHRPAPPPRRGRRPYWAVAGAGVLVLLLGVISGTLWSGTGGRGRGEIVLEGVASPGFDPFAGDFSTLLSGGLAPAPPAALATDRPPTVRTLSGGADGLYGGIAETTACDRDGMAAFLRANPDRAAAWVGALNADPTLRWSGGQRLSTADIPAYLAELTPVVLREDTRVTNHGFRSGRANPFQSVLQAGTPVLIDTFGVPRARCNCANPLRAFEAQATQSFFAGQAWEGFDPANLTGIEPADRPIPELVLTDVGGGQQIYRPMGNTGNLDLDGTQQYLLRPNGWGPIRFGMSPEEAVRATGGAFEWEYQQTGRYNCGFGQVQGAAQELEFRIFDGVVTDASVFSYQGGPDVSSFQTVGGATFGMTESQLRSIADQQGFDVTENTYYVYEPSLTFLPSDPSSGDYGIGFYLETVNTQEPVVTQITIGFSDSLGGEGCV